MLLKRHGLVREHRGGVWERLRDRRHRGRPERATSPTTRSAASRTAQKLRRDGALLPDRALPHAVHPGVLRRGASPTTSAAATATTTRRAPPARGAHANEPPRAARPWSDRIVAPPRRSRAPAAFGVGEEVAARHLRRGDGDGAGRRPRRGRLRRPRHAHDPHRAAAPDSAERPAGALRACCGGGRRGAELRRRAPFPPPCPRVAMGRPLHRARPVELRSAPRAGDRLLRWPHPGAVDEFMASHGRDATTTGSTCRRTRRAGLQRVSFMRADQLRRECGFLVQAHGVADVYLIFHGPAEDGPPQATCADYRRKLPDPRRGRSAPSSSATPHEVIRHGFGWQLTPGCTRSAARSPAQGGCSSSPRPRPAAAPPTRCPSDGKPARGTLPTLSPASLSHRPRRGGTRAKRAAPRTSLGVLLAAAPS